MSELIRPIDDVPVGEEQDSNLTYFAFAKSHKAEAAPAPTRGSICELPDVLAGRYRIERLLGEGGMGAVYEATQLSTGRPRALKVMHRETLRDASSRRLSHTSTGSSSAGPLGG